MGISSKRQKEEIEGITAEQKQQLQQVLQEFEAMFAIPEGLPPCREVDHGIPIKAEIDPKCKAI